MGPLLPCGPPHDSYPFCNTSLSPSARAESLISLLTLPQKISLLSDNATAIPSLGIPEYFWWSESLHGICDNGPGITFHGPIPAATLFPQVIVSASSFNRTLWRAIASAISTEAMAMRNMGQAGLTFWAPNINVFRDPRWGRGQETSGEDPMVAAAFSVEYVQGFQGKDGYTLSACCKHFSAYDLEKWGNDTRYIFNAKVTDQDMADTFQPPFKTCIEEGHASCLMCSYNQINGVPACAHHDLLQKARNEWGFDGYIISDCDAVAIIYEDQKYAPTPEDAVADVLKAGMDLDCGSYLKRHTAAAVKKGLVLEKDIDRALLSAYSVLIRLGQFDGEYRSKQKFGRYGPENVCTREHRELAVEAARQGIVLLKNDDNFLPLKKSDVTSVAIIGPGANDTSVLGGDYTGSSCNPESLLKGLQSYIPATTFASGCEKVVCNSSAGFAEAVSIASKAEFVVVVAGLNLTIETEDLDRTSLLLPGKQMELVNAVAKASKRRIVLVLTGGGGIDISFAKENEKIASIIWIGYPGEVGAQVLAEAIFGEFNPGGRLPVTWYPESFVNVPMSKMNMRADPSQGYPGRTYRFYTGEVVYGYGYGLSYTTYSYKFLSAPEKISISKSSNSLINKNPRYKLADGLDYVQIDKISSCNALKFGVKILVSNDGDMDGSRGVLLFSRSKLKTKDSPLKQLVGFERVNTFARKTSGVEIMVDPCKHLSFANEEGEMVLLLGDHVLMLEDQEHVFSIEK